jgi:hypothetical protein
MPRGPLSRIADNAQSQSLASHMRRKRFGQFYELVKQVPRPVRILDVGGTQGFWEQMPFPADDPISVVLLNLKKEGTSKESFTSVAGDARDMHEFAEGEFDVVFSNSVIEHVGTLSDQRRMAGEVQRVGKAYFVQTPNRYFPLEPHFLFPFFQFLPMGLRVWLAMRFRLGWFDRFEDPQAARQAVASIRLMTYRELREAFPAGTITRERVLGLTKSFTAWDFSPYSAHQATGES